MLRSLRAISAHQFIVIYCSVVCRWRLRDSTPCPDKKWTPRTSVIASRNVSQFK